MKLTRTLCLLMISATFVSCSSSVTPKSDVSATAPKVILSSPIAGSKISNPVTVIGTAPGTWFSEGQLPVEILASDGTSIALVSAEAQGEWMTEKQVPFQAIVTFNTSAKDGTLVIRKDNPSGLPENDDSFSIGVTF